jgi:hypothetical protein
MATPLMTTEVIGEMKIPSITPAYMVVEEQCIAEMEVTTESCGSAPLEVVGRRKAVPKAIASAAAEKEP